MNFSGFNESDFNVFNVDGLDERMEALKGQIRPKLEELGNHFAPTLSAMTGDEMFPHVAKHARRSVNPPDDTWVAFANSKRGYKKLPHFQIGLWETHVFVWFAVIYESPIKTDFAKALKLHLSEVQKEIPSSFVWSIDHTKPEATKQGDLSEESFRNMIDRLQNVKKAEILCGINVQNDDPVLKDGDVFVKKVESTFETLMPLYRLAQNSI